MPDADLPHCAPRVKEHILQHFDKVHKRVMRIRAFTIIAIGLVVILVVGRFSWRISARNDPAQLAGPNQQHGIPPKPPTITPPPINEPAIERWGGPRRNYYRYPKPNKNGIQPIVTPPQPLREMPLLS
jgi:hypothetical protein